jgi:hypothetical protein
MDFFQYIGKTMYKQITKFGKSSSTWYEASSDLQKKSWWAGEYTGGIRVTRAILHGETENCCRKSDQMS